MTVGIEALWYQFDYFVDLGAAGGDDGDPGDFIDLDGIFQVRMTANYCF